MSEGLSKKEILLIVNHYIGVSSGYLGDFSYRTHAEFYPMYCNLDIDPDQLPGTTRERFMAILSSQPPRDQAQIIKGVLDRFPLNAEGGPGTRTQELQDELRRAARRLEAGDISISISTPVTSEFVVHALHDAEILLKESNPSSAVDRLFSAVYGYMESMLEEVPVSYGSDVPISVLYKALRENHPAFLPSGPRSGDIHTILRNLSAIVDAVQPLRNKASMAHVNPLLPQPEALLVINVLKTLFLYLESKVQQWDEMADELQ